MSRQPSDPQQERALGKINFQFLVGGKNVYAGGEYESFVHEGETVEEAMMRASDNALTIAFEVRDSFVRRSKNSTEER